MRALIQRVNKASVAVGDETTGEIGPGLVILLGVSKEDEDVDVEYLVEKIKNLRIFADDQNRFNRSALDVGAEFLVVSQFTLYADVLVFFGDCQKGDYTQEITFASIRLPVRKLRKRV